MMKRIFLLLALLILLQADLALAAPSKDEGTVLNRPLIVAIQRDETFVRKAKDGSFTGPMVDFWDLVAKELKRPYVFKEMQLNNILSSLQSNTIDVAATTMFITADRERLFELSTTLDEGRTALLTLYKAKHEHPWIEAVEIFLSWRTIKIISLLVVVLICLGVVMWLIERKENPEDFSPTLLKGAAAGIYWAGSTLASGLCLGINLKSLKGRFFGLIWMMVCALALGAFIASLTRSLSVQLQETQVLDDADLRYMRLGVKKGSVQAQNVKEIGGHYILFDRDEDAVNALLDSQIDGYLCVESRAYHYANGAFAGRVSVYETSLKGYLYALAMPKDSTLRKPINIAILKLMEESAWESLMERYGLEKPSKQKRSP